MEFYRSGVKKAFLLAAGLGKRLRPFTDNKPKCLIEVGDKSMLEHWLDKLNRLGIDDILVSLHHHGEMVEQYLKENYHGKAAVHIVHEKELLGTGGTLKANYDFVSGSGPFIIAYADNFTTMDLSRIAAFHLQTPGILTMGLFETNNSRGCGIVDVSDNCRILAYKEKPADPVSNLANAGIYVAEEEIYDYFPDRSFFDLGYDVLSNLIGKMFGYRIWDYYIDIGTPENLKKAREYADSHRLSTGKYAPARQCGFPRSIRTVNTRFEYEEEEIPICKS